jgi:hypothetical protein
LFHYERRLAVSLILAGITGVFGVSVGAAAVL